MAERIVEVLWEDANTHHNWHRNDTPLIRPSACRTVGYVLDDTKQELILTMGFDEQIDHPGNRDCTTAIPKKAIRTVRTLARRKKHA